MSFSALELLQLFSKRQKQKNLAHFYIIESPNKLDIQDEGHSLHFAKDLLNTLLHGHGLTLDLEKRIARPEGHEQALTILCHGDILWMEPSLSGKYLVDDFGDFFNFLEMSHESLDHRYLFCLDSHAISSRDMAHKLLKTLESPNKNSTLFFFCRENYRFLDTIESRAIRFKIKRPLSHSSFLPDPNKLIESFQNQEIFCQFIDKHLSPSKNFSQQLFQFLKGELSISEAIHALRSETDLLAHLSTLLVVLSSGNYIPGRVIPTLIEKMRDAQTWETYNLPDTTVYYWPLLELKEAFHQSQS